MTKLLQPSPYDGDRGELVGRDPRTLSKAELAELDTPKSPIKAIRAKCLDCVGYVPSEVRKCTATACPLWPMRMARNVFSGLAGPRLKSAPTAGKKIEVTEPGRLAREAAE